MYNHKGIAEVALLAYVILGLTLLFVPNPLSSSLGVGIRPNKTVQVEKVELLVDKQGNPIKAQDGTYMIRRSVMDNDIQQHVGFWEWLRSLPILVILLMGLGVVFPPLSIFLGNIYKGLKADTKKIVHSVNAGLDKIDDPIKRQSVLDAMSKVQDTSTKSLVSKMKKL